MPFPGPTSCQLALGRHWTTSTSGCEEPHYCHANHFWQLSNIFLFGCNWKLKNEKYNLSWCHCVPIILTPPPPTTHLSTHLFSDKRKRNKFCIHIGEVILLIWITICCIMSRLYHPTFKVPFLPNCWPMQSVMRQPPELACVQDDTTRALTRPRMYHPEK